MKLDNYLITGANGLLGKKILKDLISKKFDVRGLDKNISRDNLKKKLLNAIY